MNFNYEEWEPKVLAFLNKTWVPEKEEELAFCDLIEEADYSNDIRAIKLLFFVYTRYDLNLDETILNTLSSMEYKLYYEVYFQNVHGLLNKGEFGLDKHKTVNLSDFTLRDITEDDYYKSGTVALLSWIMRDLTDEEIDSILPLVRKYLNHDDMKILMERLIKWGYEDDGSFKSQVLDEIKQRLKEACPQIEVEV